MRSWLKQILFQFLSKWQQHQRRDRTPECTSDYCHWLQCEYAVHTGHMWTWPRSRPYVEPSVVLQTLWRLSELLSSLTSSRWHVARFAVTAPAIAAGLSVCLSLSVLPACAHCLHASLATVCRLLASDDHCLRWSAEGWFNQTVKWDCWLGCNNEWIN